MKKSKVWLLILALILVFTLIFIQASKTTSNVNVETITVSAASGLKDALGEIQKQFEASNKNIKVQFNFGASGALKKRVEEGAPVDLFISADTKSINDLEVKKLVVTESKASLLGNELVLIINKEYKDKIKSINDLLKADVKYISIGMPASVPAGAYAKESLTSEKLWDKLASKFVYGKDVKQVLTYVESGDAAAGIVYATDARLAKSSTVVQVLPPISHSPILYASAVISASKHQYAAHTFLDYLKQSTAQEIFEKYGFSIIKK